MMFKRLFYLLTITNCQECVKMNNFIKNNMNFSLFYDLESSLRWNKSLDEKGLKNIHHDQTFGHLT